MPNDEQKKPDDSQAAPPTASAPPKEDESLDATAPQPAAADQPTSDQSGSKPKKAGFIHRFSITGNLYLIVFALLVLTAGVVVYVSLKTSKAGETTTKKTSSLTDQQIASLNGNTTLVGDAKQTLDIQSNSIFEGQVLMKSDLNVAGALQVGKSLSLPSVTVGGAGTFGQLGVNGGFNVKGDTTLQGQLTVQKNLNVSGSASFGSLDVSTLSVTSLKLRGDLNLSQHIITSGGAPGRSTSSSIGAGGTASVSGTDTAGRVVINTGSSPSAGCMVTINFTTNFSSTPHVVISPASSSGAAIQYYATPTSSGFSVCSANAPGGGQNLIYDYIVIK